MNKHISTREGVDKWLSLFETEMKLTMKGNVMKILDHSYSQQKPFVPVSFYQTYGQTHVTQMCLLASHVLHSLELFAVDGTKKQSMTNLLAAQNDTISNLIQLGSTVFTGSKLQSFLAIEIYYRDIISVINDANNKSFGEYKMYSANKYLLEDDFSTIFVSSSHYSIEYGFEYISGDTRLVWNPILETCFNSLWV